MAPTATTRTHVWPLYSSPVETADGRRLPSTGAQVCRWIEACCVYGEGDWLGEPVRLRAWQKRIIWRLYEFYPETGRRRYRRALYGCAKGNGKSPLASWIGAYELCGGRTKAPRVIIGAASLKQANLVFGDLRMTMTGLPDNPSPLSKFVDAYDLQVLLRDRPGVAERVAAVAGTNDGARATCFIPDELHEWDGQLARVYLVLDGAIAKRRGAFTFGITTAGEDREDNLARQQWEYGKLVASGEKVDDSFLFEWYEAPGDLDLTDDEQWLAAVLAANPAAGDFNDIDQIRFRFDSIAEHEFRRYHLNQFVRPKGSWLPAGKWGPLEGRHRAPDKATPIVLGFDGSYNRDSTALVGCTLGGHLFVIKAWEREADTREDWVVPRHEVDAAVDKAMKRFNVQEMACDPHRWTSEIGEWMERYGDVVVEFPTHSAARMAPACSRFYAAVVDREAKLTHDGDPALSRHLHNAVVRETRDGAYITKEHRDSPRRIDLAIAAVMAYDRACWHAQNPRKRAVAMVIGGDEG